MSAVVDVEPETLREIARLSGLARGDLRIEWRRLLGSEPPDISRDLLLRALTYALQERCQGGLSKEAERMVRGKKEVPPTASPRPRPARASCARDAARRRW